MTTFSHISRVTARSAASTAASSRAPSCTRMLREVLDRCEELRERDGGLLRYQRPISIANGADPDRVTAGPGSLDPSGFVKGWAIGRVAQRLNDAGARTSRSTPAATRMLAGHPDGDDRWRVGIQHPRSPRDIAMTLGAAGYGGRHLRRLRSRRAHHRPADRPARLRAAVGDDRRSRRRHRRRVCDSRVRDGRGARGPLLCAA